MNSRNASILSLNDTDSECCASKNSSSSTMSSSVFSDAACGEPLMAQHLVVDFTPSDEDSDFVQKKVCAFWDFIDTQKSLRHLLTSPQASIYPRESETSESLETSIPSEPEPSEAVESMPTERTALSMLEIVDAKGLINRIFEAKLPQTQCSNGSREYRDKEQQPPLQKKPVCKCTTASKQSVTKRPRGVHPVIDLKLLTRTARDWDSEHSKSLEPPGQVPTFNHCVMQRKIRN